MSSSGILPLDGVSRVTLDLDERLNIRTCGIGDLPVEILGHIFSMIHSQTISSSMTKFTTSDTVLRLSHVHPLWRETCISVSSLWSHIHIIRASSDEVKRTEMFLKRSGTSLLTIEFHARANTIPYTPEANRMIQKLFAACERWKEASFSVQARSIEQVMIALFGENGTAQLEKKFHFPFLETFSFTSRLESQNRRFFDMFQQQSTPRLHNLVIPNYTTFLPFAFGQITDLTLSKMNKDFPDLSVLCPHLVRLKIGQTFGESNEPTPVHAATTFELPKLETMIVSCSGPGRLWGMLTLPSLRNLALEAITFMPLEHVAILNMLRRSGCAMGLRRLTLAYMDITDVDVMSMLSLMPQLEEFVLHETLVRQQKILTPKLLMVLKLPNTDQDLATNASAFVSPAVTRAHFIPNLAYIELQVYYFPSFGLDLLFDMLSSRAVISSKDHSSSYSTKQATGTLEQIVLCFVLDEVNPPFQIPLELENMVNRLRLVSASHIQSIVQCGQEWKKEF
ncbi:hypothetical protein EV368DRAFT_81045 [Lentinula lateritia]|uniref:Uncharacterized protein n=1 Tax=Lentinula aff. lateritia TaxID=2804960 RepID=A0ACC1TZ99_9AGAR|nr:hypothetical protein F5876DRAFT_77100 [Lentinula aff. lateritia]KAJ3853999.1 hypothetical protein EV368DRAFT_81045 [Lentinula lateritia]